MACERWCFSDSSRSTILLAILCTIGFAHAANDPSYYNYGLTTGGKSSIEFSSALFDFVPEDKLVRIRRTPTEQTSNGTVSQLELAKQQQQRLLLEPLPSSSVTNATSANSTNVSYSTDTAGTLGSTTAEPIKKTDDVTPKIVVSQPIIPSTGQNTNLTGTIWANQTMWTNVTDKATTLKNVTLSVDHSTPDKASDPKSKKEKEKAAETDKAKEKPKDKNNADADDDDEIKFPNGVTNQTLSQNNITETKVDTHEYYNSTFIINEAIGREFWVDMDNHPNLRVNQVLSQSHRRAATVELKFDFPFYGQKVRNITIATGGFLYTGDYVHSWLAATQYIAPLMANFDTRLSNESQVKYADNGTAFTVEWENVILQDKPKGGAFTFQATLLQSGDIIFVYSKIPVMVENIEDTAHPVKVGLSDAYIMDRTIFFVRRKTIYEYHRVNFNRQDIKNWTVIYLRALPTCLAMDNCRDCLTKIKDFDCKWCSELNQCSTGTFRSRQEWLLKGCDVRHVKDPNNCPAMSTYKEHVEGFDHGGHVRTDDVTANHDDSQSKGPGTSPLEHAQRDMNMGVSGIIGILLVVGLVAGIAAWAAYAYRNPHSTSGQMLIRYRPSQWSWRRGEARYTAATIHM